MGKDQIVPAANFFKANTLQTKLTRTATETEYILEVSFTLNSADATVTGGKYDGDANTQTILTKCDGTTNRINKDPLIVFKQVGSEYKMIVTTLLSAKVPGTNG